MALARGRARARLARAAPAPLLLEREAELQRFERLLDGCCRGAGELALVSGPAGIGKTALLGAVRERAVARGVRVLSARGGALERDFVFGVVRQLFERPLHATGRRERGQVLSGAAQLAAPLLGFAPPGEGEPLASDREMAVLHALYWLTANLADGVPLLLVIDDAHWSDPGSLHFIAYLARRVGELQAAVALGARSEDPTTATLLDAVGVRADGALSAERHGGQSPRARRARRGRRTRVLRSGSHRREREPGAEGHTPVWRWAAARREPSARRCRRRPG